MELVDRYLYEIKRYLPQGQREDIAAEIGDDLASQIENKESALGRPLNRDEQAELIKAYGHPKIVASRYGSQQYLIGPTLLPFYFYTLKIVGVILLILVAIAVAAHSGGDALSSFAFAWGLFLNSAMFAVGVVTTVFAAIEYSSAKRGGSFSLKWDPRTLPPAGQRKVPISQSIFELVFSLIFLAWVLDVPGIHTSLSQALLGPGAAYAQHGPFKVAGSWHVILLSLALVAAVQIGLSILNLVRPDWVRLRAAVTAAENMFLALVLGSTILHGQPYVLLAGPGKHGAGYASAAVALNEVLVATAVVWVIIDVILVIVNVRMLLQRDAPVIGLARQ
ncbi:MAG: hypothetical protein M3007_05940 [Candidatus Eremiobacteraeota bacterium]|nr:hypothetical protein [Candidatus Eremiobacteraeota bacterium]